MCNSSPGSWHQQGGIPAGQPLKRLNSFGQKQKQDHSGWPVLDYQHHRSRKRAAPSHRSFSTQKCFPLCCRSVLLHFQNLCITWSSQIPNSECFLQTFSLLLINSDTARTKGAFQNSKVAVRFNVGRESELL